MRPEDLGWFAGIIDGEGSISLDRVRQWRRPSISVSSTDVEIVDALRELAGGTISIARAKKDRSPTHKLCYRWCLHGGQQAVALLTQIEPFLRCPKKKVRARHIIGNYAAVTARNGYLTPESRARKLDFERVFFELEA